ncbi:tandem-95 repeat protein [Caulobacter sp. FWC26]|nr:tandem-95 repeat protein [Caulobacter sp. FWC26]
MAQTATTTTLMSTQNPSVVNPYGSPSGVTLYVTISPNPGSGNGSVRFTDNGADISGCTSVQVQSGVASCSMGGGLPMGTRSIVAYYSGGTGYAASVSSTLTQYSVRGPSVAASYAASSIRQDQSTTLTITLTNPNTVALGGVRLPATDLSSFSGATISLGAGTCSSSPRIDFGEVSLSNQTLAANSSCTVVVNIPAGQPTGTRYVNPQSPTATTANGVSGFSLTGSSGGQQNLTVTAGVPAPPTITVSRTTFPGAIAVGGTTQLTFTLSNPNAFLITGVGTTLTLPSELVIHQNSGSDFTTTCTNASLLGSTGGGSVRLIGGRISANGSCTFTVTVRGASAGSVSVPTGAPSATNAAAGAEGSPLAITVNPTLTVTQAVASTVLTQNVAATAFTPVTASGGAGPLTYAITSGGALPTGLIFSTSTGQISGTPTSTKARTTYNVTVTDQSVPTAITGTTTFDLTVNAAFTPTPTLTFATPTSASVTMGGSLTNAATSTLSGGNFGAISYASSDPGIATVSASGVVTPVGVGAATITATQAAVAGVNAQASQTYVLTVALPPAPTVASTSVDVAYNSPGQAVSLPVSGQYTALAISSAPTNGKVSVNGATATYIPTPGFSGGDSFTYIATGLGGASAPATVTLRVVPPGAPTVAAISVSVAYNSPGQTFNLPASGEFTALTVASASANGRVTISGTTATYVPTPGFFGADSFTYSASGPGGASNAATVTLDVARPDAPTALAASANVAFNSSGQTVALPTSGAVTALALLTDPINGKVTINGATATYVPTPGFFGADSFTYTATGPGGTSSPAAVTLTVARPEPPTVAAVSADVAYNSVGQAVSLAASGVFTALTVATAPTNGKVTISGTTALYVPTPGFSGSDSFTYTATGPGGGSAPATVTLTVASPRTLTVAAAFADVAYNSPGQAVSLKATGAFTALVVATAPTNGTVTINGVTAVYVPTPGFSGGDSFTYFATGPGGVSPPATVTLTVARPDAPTVAADSVNVAFNSAGQTVRLAASGVFTALTVATAPTNGKVTINGATAIYVPNPGFFGADSFTYTATGPGGTSAPATITLAVARPPPAPVVVSLPATATTAVVPSAAGGSGASVTVDLTTVATGSVTGFEVTAPGQYGQVAIEEVILGSSMALAEDVARPSRPRSSSMLGYRLRYTPNPGFMGVDTVTLVAVGQGGRSAPVVFTFNVPGKAPDLSARVLSSGSVTLTPTTGVIGGPFQGLRIIRAPAFGTAITSGLTLVFAPGAGGSGAASLDYVVELPFGSSGVGRIDLQADPVPVVAPIKITTQAGRPVTTSVTANAQGGPFISAAVVSLSVPSAGKATLTAGGSAGARTYDLTFTPDGQFAGQVDVRFTLSNAFATSTGLVQITVEPRPDPSRDPDTRALISGQADTAWRFARAQTENFSRRLEQIRGGDNRSQNGLSVNMGAFRDTKRTPNVEFQQQLGLDVDEQGRSPRDRAYQAEERAFLDGFKMRSAALASSASDADDDSGLSDPASSPKARVGSPSKVGVWAGGGLDWGHRDAQGLRDTRFSTSGVSGGADLKVNDNLILGGGFGYGGDRTRIGSQGTAFDSETLVGVLYGSWRAAPDLHLEGLIGYGRLDYGSRRWSPEESGFALGRRSGNLTFGSVGLAYDRRSGRRARSLYGRMETSRASLAAFTETGAGISALHYQAITPATVTGNLGVKLEWIVEARTFVFAPSARMEWRHEFQQPGDQTISYADWLDGPLYNVSLDGWSRDSLALELGGRWTLGDNLDIDASYRSTLVSNGSSQGLHLKLIARF